MRPDSRPEGIRQSMSWLHTWTGIVLGWLLYAVFFTGTLSYFLDEVNLWMKPELHASVPGADAAQTAAVAMAGMQKLAPNANTWTLELPNERQTTVSASWRDRNAAAGRAGTRRAELDAATGEKIAARETRGGSFLYRFHFELHAMDRVTGRWIVGIATMFMFVAIISGVITHKKIFTEFFTFRPKKGQRSWLDAHNATAVLALPFHIMITFSGLLLLMGTLMPWGAESAYGGDRQAYNMERRGMVPGGQQQQQQQQQGGSEGRVGGREGSRSGPESGRGGRSRDGAGSGVDLAAAIVPMMAQARTEWPGHEVGRITVNRPNKPGATVELRAHGSDSLTTRGASARLVFDAATGKIKERPPLPAPSAASAFGNVFASAHMGRFAGPTVRWLLFLSGVVGTAMVATGLVLWVVKRAPERRKLGRTPFGHRVVEVTNVGVITGLALATGAYFWLNRLLPVEMAERSAWEINGFFLAWLAALVHAAVRPARAAWIEQCIAVVVLFALLPVLNPLTGGHGLLTSIPLGQAGIVGFDFAMLAIAALFGWIARHLLRKDRPAARAVPAALKEVTP
ncbi:PepSY-associated TM helix domain-containing protein [Pseudoduganella umbonata]|uniref:PepSY domain-containing protein n=1 Tax=Pseudoduganella umbonata TaxID=864828 RepID=A0A4P8HQV7_9BURK|nr:PepSY-associated TM helix domain-containing protein [Pseudoduganella umbonata]MBB3220258.1 putative iron-regulated membrane protein [Pseudoduganella umbonata]QCP12199.1 PepSY domain-containing protein [Pseudoduganella umbonata]